MHLLFLTHHFPLPTEPGAPRPWQLAKYFANRGHKVTVVAAEYNYMSGKRAPEQGKSGLWRVEEVPLQNVQCIRTWALPDYKTSVLRRVGSYASYSALAFASSLGLDDVDVVLTPNNPPTNTVAGFLLARMTGALFVEEIREPHPEFDVALGYFTSKPVREAYRAYHDLFHRHSDLIVSLTPGITRILQRRGVDPAKILDVPNAYDLEADDLLLSYTPEQAKRQCGWGPEVVVLYGGSHGLVPQLRVLLETAKRLRDDKNIRFVLIGDGDKQRYIDYAKANNLDNCEFLPGQPRERMPLFYRAADICTHLIPKGDVWECILPNKVFDYLGSGKPIAFSGRGDTADLIATAGAGISVEPGDPDALANAIRTLAQDQPRREAMGKRGRDYVLTHHSRPLLMGRLEAELHRLLAS